MRIQSTVVRLDGAGAFGLVVEGRRFVMVESMADTHRAAALECFGFFPQASHVFTQDGGPGVLTWRRVDLFPVPVAA